MEKMMASFGEGYTKTQVISENNSIKYKLSFAAGSEFSTPSSGYFTFQDELLGEQQDGAGINIREFNPATNTISSKKTFLLSATDGGGANTTFLEYLDSFTADNKNLLIFTTGSNLRSSDSIDAKFASYFSKLWPGKWLTSNYPCCYVGLYSPAERKMISENVNYSDGVLRDEDIRPALEYVYDKSNDIGATGYIHRAIDDYGEYVNSNATIKRYPVADASGVTLTSIGIKPGDILFWSFDFFHGTDLIPSGRNIRVSLRWLNASSGVVSTVNVDSSPSNAGNWIHHERNVVVPEGAVRVTILVSKTSGTDPVGEGGVRDMILTEVSRRLESFSTAASISVNGIRMNNAISGSDPTLLKLPALEVDASGKPLPGEDVSGNIYSSNWSEFEKNI
ncbi:long tail fiber proximal hinge connector [Citrobacter phage CkP1]|nr:long tail fiber proximal hinge connector [Citrobacter phage CkP1]